MSRRTLCTMRGAALALFALGGIAACFGSLALLTLGPGMLADARTPNLTGQGVSVWLVDRWIAPGDTMRLEVEAHGGSAAGVERVAIWRDGVIVARAEGGGRDWGSTLTSRSRGAETVELALEIPRDATPGEPITLTVAVDSVAAMASGASSFTNERFHDEIALVVTPRVGAGAILARALSVLYALLALAIWSALVLGGAHLVQTYDRPGGDPNTGQMLGSAAIGFLIGGAVIGYWVFARPVAAALGSPWGLDYALAGAWLAGPPWLAWRWLRDRVPAHCYTLHVTATPAKEGYRAREDATPEVSLDAVSEALAAAGWKLARRRPGRVRATKEKSRVEVRGSDLVTTPSELEIEATDASAPLHVAKRLAATFGALRVRGPGLDALVAPDADVDAILGEQLRRTIERARAILARRL